MPIQLLASHSCMVPVAKTQVKALTFTLNSNQHIEPPHQEPPAFRALAM
jgi:hypothetical protein